MTRPYPLRHVVCEECGKQCTSERKDRDICRSCYRGEATTRCIRCGQVKHGVAKGSGLCPRCASRQEATCARCLRTRIIYNPGEQLCRECNRNLRAVTRKRSLRQSKVECSVCGKMRPPRLLSRAICRTCTVRSLYKVERYAHNTVRNQRAKLRVFFDWARINRLVITNPVQYKTPAPDPTISQYPPDVIRQLCLYLAASDANPVEAMILYLIIFHAFSVQELRNAEIPVYSLKKGSPSLRLAEAYAVIVPELVPSLGHCKPGRPDIRLDFPLKAASWLKPLLERFESWRQQAVKNPGNRYLFVAPSRSRHNTPVGKVFIWEVVQRASLRVLGAACNPNTLRKTVGVMFADRAGAGVLRWMGWGEQQAFAYTWAPRKTILPQQPNSSQPVEANSNALPVIFPSPGEGLRERNGQSSERSN